jgi:hypothetical protein
MSWCGCRLAPLTLHTFYKRKERIYIAQVLGLRHKQIGEKSASVLFVLFKERKSDLMLHTSTHILIQVLLIRLSHSHLCKERITIGDSLFGKESCVFNLVPQSVSSFLPIMERHHALNVQVCSVLSSF